MRGSNALLVTGAVALAAGLAGPSLAAEDTGADASGVEVEAVGGEPAAEPAPPAGTLPDEPPSTVPVPGADDRPPAREVYEIDAENSYGERRGGEGRGGDGSGDAGGRQLLKTAEVVMEDFAFKPKTITIDPGDEVTWTNRDTAQHDAVGQGAADFETDLLAKGQTATVPFNETGTFDYICSVHPTDMKGKVIVRSGGSGGSGGKGGSSDGTGGTSSSTDSTTPTSPTASSGGSSSGSSSSGGGSLPNTGGPELPLLVLGTALIVIGLLSRAFREYWIWR